MLQFNVLGFPVTIQPWFWLIGVMFGGGFSADTQAEWIDVALRIVVILISILVHELGHALALRKLGHYSEIELHGFGGATYHHAGLSRGQSIFVSSAGPFAGFVLAGIALVFNKVVVTEYAAVHTLIDTAMVVNIFWTIMNLLPVLPMDGGQISRELLGPKRLQIACILGGIVALCMVGLAVQFRLVYTAFLFGYFAWINFSNGFAEGGVNRR